MAVTQASPIISLGMASMGGSFPYEPEDKEYRK